MAAPSGNQFWKLRSKHGRDKLFTTPNLLWDAAAEYFNWVDAHPWYKVEGIKSGEAAGTLMKIPTARPYTIEGFLNYVEAGDSYWRNFKKANHQDFAAVIERIESVIYQQKFEGAAVGSFNANLIARDLGIADKQELVGKGDTDLFKEKTDEDLKAILRDISSKLNESD